MIEGIDGGSKLLRQCPLDSFARRIKLDIADAGAGPSNERASILNNIQGGRRRGLLRDVVDVVSTVMKSVICILNTSNNPYRKVDEQLNANYEFVVNIS